MSKVTMLKAATGGSIAIDALRELAIGSRTDKEKAAYLAAAALIADAMIKVKPLIYRLT